MEREKRASHRHEFGLFLDIPDTLSYPKRIIRSRERVDRMSVSIAAPSRTWGSYFPENGKLHKVFTVSSQTHSFASFTVLTGRGVGNRCVMHCLGKHLRSSDTMTILLRKFNNRREVCIADAHVNSLTLTGTMKGVAFVWIAV